MSLFQTNAWQKAWWREWSKTPGIRLLWEGGDGLSGVYVHSYTQLLPLKTRCLQFVGTSYRQFSAPRTEYNRLANSDGLRDTLARMERANWTEAVLADMELESSELTAIKRWAALNGWYLRNIRQDYAYGVNTTTTFAQYLNSLGKSTRLKLFNRRKVLESVANVVDENFWPDRVREFFKLLNDFHKKRWGRPCFGDRSISFHLDFLEQGIAENIQPLLMVLYNGKRPVSVQYNVAHAGTVYNIQVGYEEKFNKKIALGTLHIGYAIESAFNDPSIKYFDLLAGDGKNTNYKCHLATEVRSLASFMIVRSQVFNFLYKIKDIVS